MALNTRQEKFLKNYLSGMSGAEAYRQAGYSPKGADQSAYKLLRKAEIKKAVARHRTRQEWNRNKVLERFAYMHEFNSEVIEGEHGARMVDAAVAHRSLDSLAKVLRLYEPDPAQVNVQVNNYAIVEVPGRSVSDSDDTGIIEGTVVEGYAETAGVPRRR